MLHIDLMQSDLLENLNNSFLKLMTIVIGGDFNCILDGKFDKKLRY